MVADEIVQMWQALVGRRSAPVLNWVERGAVRRFAEAIGDPNPLYVDEQAARQSRHGRLIAPPTFPITFDHGTIDGLDLPESGVIHGEQGFDYVQGRPLYVGEAVSCYSRCDEAYEKKGKQGMLYFLVVTDVGEDEAGTPLYAARQNLILTETVANLLRASGSST